MKRLVYAPQINVWVKSEYGIIDLSPYVTDFEINRKVDEVSSAKVSFRNPKEVGPDGEPRFMFTQHPVENEDGSYSYKPLFYPMDPIIITLTRLRGYPVQVFTGYCDTTPYIQLFPGTATIKASCTLKRLLYTFWDPGLPFVNEYLVSLGWGQGDPNNSSKIINPQAETANKTNLGLTDGSFGFLIYRILQDIGNWSHDDIYVQGIPGEAIDKVVDGIYTEMTGEAKASFAEYREFLKKVIGTSTVGGAVGNGGTGNSTNTNGGSNLPPYNGKQGRLTPTEAKSAAKSMLKDFGWPESEFDPLEKLWEGESSWQWNSLNTSSGAYGIPQSLPASKMGNRSEGGGPDYMDNAVTQMRWGMTYIKNRYHTPTEAYSTWQSRNPHWY